MMLSHDVFSEFLVSWNVDAILEGPSLVVLTLPVGLLLSNRKLNLFVQIIAIVNDSRKE